MRVFIYSMCLLFYVMTFSACGNIDFAYDPQKDYSFVATEEDKGVFENPPSGKAGIYGFRDDSIYGMAITYNLFLYTKDQESEWRTYGAFLGKSRYGGAFMVDITPNNEELYIRAQTEAKDILVFTPQSSRIYCLASGIATGFFIGRPKLTLVEKDVCRKFIAEYLNEKSMQQWQEDKAKFDKKQERRKKRKNKGEQNNTNDDNGDEVDGDD